MKYCLGKKPAQPGVYKHKFSSLFHVGQLPTPTLVFGRTLFVAEDQWGMLGNDQLGDCTIAGAEHETMLLCSLGGKPVPEFNSHTAISDYSSACGYQPGNPSTDNGGYLSDVAQYRQDTGMIDTRGIRHKIDGFAELAVNNIDQIALAAYTLGVVGIGVNLPDSSEQQFDDKVPWDIVPWAKVVGGHYVPLVGRNRDGNYIIVTWGRAHAVTPAFLQHYMDEAVVYLVFEQIRNGVSQRGYDEAGLRAAFGRF